MKSGSLFKASGMVVGVVDCNCSVVTTVIGVGDRVISEMTREPVTVTVSVFGSWARAPAVRATTLAAHISAILELVFMETPCCLIFICLSRRLACRVGVFWQRCQAKNDSATIFARCFRN